MVGLFLCLKHQKSSQIINQFLAIIPTPDHPVQPHNRGNRPINLLRGLLLVCLDVPRRLRPNIDIVHQLLIRGDIPSFATQKLSLTPGSYSYCCYYRQA